MKIKRSVLEKIVREELAAHFKKLSEAPELEDAQDDNKKKEAGPKEPSEKEKSKDSKAPPAKDEPKKAEKKPAEPAAAKELPAAEEPEADKELEKDVAEPDGEEDASEISGGEIADELTGKTIQSLTMEPKSKILPGAQEIVVQFNEIPDPLRILINKSGVVKFYFRGLHNKV